MAPTQSATLSFLKGKRVDLTKFDADRYLPDIAWKLLVSECYFMQKPRCSEVIFVTEAVLIRFSFGDRILLQQVVPDATAPPDATKLLPRASAPRLPTMVRLHGESPHATALRFWVNALGLPDDSVYFIEDKVVDEELDIYPGLRTLQRARLVTAHLSVEDTELLEEIGLPKHTPFSSVDVTNSNITYKWSWATVKECGLDHDAVVQSSLSELNTINTAQSDKGALVKRLLARYNIDTSSWDGRGKRRTVKRLVAELEMGHCSFREDGHELLMRVVRVVALRIWTPSDKYVLLQVGSETDNCVGFRFEPTLPGGKQHNRESVIECANRILKEYLQIDDEDIDFPSERSCEYKEERANECDAYPGLNILYLRHYVDCRLCTEDDDVIKRLGLSSLPNWSNDT
jgi:hypothetical protein